MQLDFYVTLCSACRILIVDNNIRHLGIKMILWNWGAGGVTETSEFYDHIKVNCLFLTLQKYSPLKETLSSKIPFLISGDQICYLIGTCISILMNMD